MFLLFQTLVLTLYKNEPWWVGLGGLRAPPPLELNRHSACKLLERRQFKFVDKRKHQIFVTNLACLPTIEVPRKSDD